MNTSRCSFAKISRGGNYFKVLSTIWQKVKPENLDTMIRSIGSTRYGNILLELGSKICEGEALSDTLWKALGEEATVKNLVPKSHSRN